MKMMDYALKMMDFVLKMMNFVLKMRSHVWQKQEEAKLEGVGQRLGGVAICIKDDDICI